jgi:hypothetical protein
VEEEKGAEVSGKGDLDRICPFLTHMLKVIVIDILESYW